MYLLKLCSFYSVQLYRFLYCCTIIYSALLFIILLHYFVYCCILLFPALLGYLVLQYAMLCFTIFYSKFASMLNLFDLISHFFSHFVFYIFCNYLGAQSYLCLCPFHEDRNPSCSISDDKGNKLCLEFLCRLIVIEV